MSKKVILIGGYSNSGRTTLMRYAASKEYLVVSFSDVLYKYCVNLIHELVEDPNKGDAEKEFIDLLLRSRIKAKIFGRGFDSTRDFMILMAKVLTDTFGREVYSNPIARMIDESESEVCVCEVYKAEDYYNLERFLVQKKIKFVAVNLRSSRENPKADDRSLIPFDLNIWNDNSFEAMYHQLDNIVKEFDQLTML